MPDNHPPKQRCAQCHSVLIKGTVIAIVGETKIKCGKCDHVNVLAVVPSKVIMPAGSDSIKEYFKTEFTGTRNFSSRIQLAR